MSKKNELAAVKNNSELMFSTNDAELMQQMAADSQEYTASVDVEDRIMPRLKLLQALSPELNKKDEEKFIEGAEAGDAVEVISKKVFKGEKGFLFVPVKNIISYVEFQGVGKGAKLINNFGSDPSAYVNAKRDEKGKAIGSKPDSRIIKTYNLYGFVYDHAEKSYTTAVIPMSGSKAAVAKKLNSLTIMSKLPAFSNIYLFTSIAQSNADGDFYNYTIKNVGMTLAIPELGKEIYKDAKELFNMLNETKPAKVYEEQEDERV